MCRMGLVASLLVWTALILPWARCMSDCHDRVLPALGDHCCHESSDCGGIGDAHEEADHERMVFESTRPGSGIPADHTCQSHLLLTKYV